MDTVKGGRAQKRARQGLTTGVGSLSEAGEKKVQPGRQNQQWREQETMVSWGDQALLMGQTG